MPGNYVRSAILVGSIPLMSERDADARALARQLGIDPAALTDPDIPVPAVLVLDFYERAAQLTAYDNFGLRMAARTGLAVIGPLWVLLRQAGTLEEMIEDLAAHFDLYTHAAVVSLRHTGRDRVLSWGVTGGFAPREAQMAEYSLAVFCGELRRHLPSGWEPASVGFRHSAPRDRSALRRVFGPNLNFDQADNSILIDRRALDQPLHGSGSRTRTMLSHLLRRTEGSTDDGLHERVDAVVRAMLPYARCTLADVGRATGMAARTLQEHLQLRGSSFQKIRDAARADLAARYLKHSRMSLTQIAEILGYSELSAFSRSFRRWHGMPARNLRERRTQRSVAESTTPEASEHLA